MINDSKSAKFIRLDSYGMGPYAMKRIKVCSKCERITSYRTLICPFCRNVLIGKTLFDRYISMHKRCRSCDIPLAKDARYCPNCGKMVDQAMHVSLIKD